jgi:hypothetical protein
MFGLHRRGLGPNRGAMDIDVAELVTDRHAAVS